MKKKKKKRTSPSEEKSTKQNFLQSIYADDKKIFLTIILVAFIIRIIYCIQLAQNNPTINLFIHDSAHFNNLARQVTEHGPILERSFYLSPLYTYFLALFYKIGIENVLIIRIVQFLLGSIACGLTFLIGKRFFPRAVLIIAVAIQIFYAPILFFEGNLLTTSLVLFLTLLSCYLLIRFTENYKYILAILSGLAFALAITGRPNLLVVLPIPILYLILTKNADEKQTTRFRSTLPWAIGFVLPFIFTTTHNYLADKTFIPLTSHGGINFYIGNHDHASGVWEAPEGMSASVGAINVEQARQVAEEETGRELSPTGVSNYWYRRTFRFIILNPISWLGLMLKKTFLFWSGYEIPLNFDYYFHQNFSFLLKTPITQFYFIFPFALLGMIIGIKEWKKRWLLYGFVTTYFLSVIIFFVSGRYRLIVIPFLLLFAGHGIYWLYDLIRQKNYRLFAISSAVLLVLLVLNTTYAFHKIKQSNFSNDYYNIALAKLYQQDYDKAIYWGKLAAKAAPKNPDIHYNLGIAYIKLQQYQAALEAFIQTLELNPNEAGALRNVGGILLMNGKTQECIPFLEKAAQLDPSSIGTFMNLGKAYFDFKDYDKAIEQWRKVLSIDPYNSMAKRNIEVARKVSGE